VALTLRYVPWRAQHVAFEILRVEVEGLARTYPRVAERVSYADLHALVGTNNCGFTTRFPHYAYFQLDKVVMWHLFADVALDTKHMIFVYELKPFLFIAHLLGVPCFYSVNLCMLSGARRA